jgi:hypothetical protein
MKITDKTTRLNAMLTVPYSLINNPYISLGAKGLWVFLNSQEQGAELNEYYIGDNKETVEKYIQELINSRLLERDAENNLYLYD